MVSDLPYAKSVHEQQVNDLKRLIRTEPFYVLTVCVPEAFYVTCGKYRNTMSCDTVNLSDV